MTSSPSQVADRARITATVRAYATAIDLRDFELLRSLVTDPVLIDFSSYDPGREATSLSVDDWIAGVRPQIVGYDASLHTITEPCITVHGDQATSVAAMRADHYYADLAASPQFTITGHYTDTLVRDGDGWRITSKVLTMTGEQGARDMMAAARQRGLERLHM